jgi:hypothetical protein
MSNLGEKVVNNKMMFCELVSESDRAKSPVTQPVPVLGQKSQSWTLVQSEPNSELPSPTTNQILRQLNVCFPPFEGILRLRIFGNPSCLQPRSNSSD